MTNERTKLFKKILSSVLCLCMAVSCFPVSAFAGTGEYVHEHTAECEHSHTEDPSQAYTVEEVKAMIDALPEVSELEYMSDDELNDVYDKTQEAVDAYESLTEDEQTGLSNEVEKLTCLLDYMNSQTMNTGASATSGPYTLTINSYKYGTNLINNYNVTDVQFSVSLQANNRLKIRFQMKFDGKTGLSAIYEVEVSNIDCTQSMNVDVVYHVSKGTTKEIKITGTLTRAAQSSHSGGTATCSTLAACQYCGTEYGSLDTNNHNVTKWENCGGNQHKGICEWCSKTVTTENCSFKNGICSVCGGYQESQKNDADCYEISNLGQLMWFAQKINAQEITSHSAILTADITIDNSVVWTPISLPDHCGSTFDGNNHTVTFANTNEGSAFGLFANYNYSTIKNLYLAGSITCNQSGDTSALVNRAYSTTIQNVISTCTVNNSGAGNTGGFTGYFGGGSATIKNSAVYADITGGGYAGGLIGSIWNGNQPCSVYNSAYIGSVSGANKAGALAGFNGNNSSKRCPFTDVYYCENNGLEYLGGTNGGTVTATRLESKTADQFKSGEVAYLLNNGVTDGTQVWYQTCKTDSYPTFKGDTVYRGYVCGSGNSEPVYANSMDGLIAFASPEHNYDDTGFCVNCKTTKSAVFDATENVYKIYNLGQLKWFADKVNGGDNSINAKLMADIDISSFENFGIGSSGKKYSGTFDGNEHTLTVKLNGSDSVALFPYVNGATVKNLTVKGSVTASNKYAATLIGQAEGNVTVEKCLSDVVITSTVNGDGTHGGLVGVLNSGTLSINNCGFTGEINGSDTTNCGGLVGWSGGKTTIANSFVAASFTLKSGDNYTFSRKPENVTVTNSYCINAFGTVNNGATKKDADIFANGEVTYLLNGESGVWKQTLGVGGDATPNFTGKTVYAVVCDCNTEYVAGYANTKGTTVAHIWGDTVYKWGNDYKSCVATRMCAACQKTETLNATGITSKTDPEPTCTTEGFVTYTATFDGWAATYEEGFSVPVKHIFTTNGFCEKCGTYQPAEKNANGYYEIFNAGQLYWFSALTNGKLTDVAQDAAANAVLMDDITVNTGVIVNGELASDVSEFLSWTPIGHSMYNGNKKYAGTFNGNGHTVSGLYTASYSRLIGFFGDLTGVVKNLTIADSYLKTSAEDAGGIAGWVEGTVEKCASVNCIIRSSRSTGGITAVMSKGNVVNCYSTAILVCDNTKCGGISGSTEGKSNIKNCYFAGKNGNNSYDGYGITYASVSSSSAQITVKNCYYLSSSNISGGVFKYGSNGTLTVTDVEEVSAERFKSGEIAWLLNNGNSEVVWKQTLGTDDYPNFTGETLCKITNSATQKDEWTNKHAYNENGVCLNCGDIKRKAAAENTDGYYEIYTVGQLMWFKDKVEKGETAINAKLMADIDASLSKFGGIGSSTNKFGGVFDGNNHTLNIKIAGEGSVALFPYVNGATIKNLTVTGNVTASSKFAASLIGQADGNVTLEKCISEVVITSTVSGDGTHGGLVGTLNSGTLNINYCGFTGAIKGSATTSCGGFVGWSNGTTNINNSYIAATFDNTSGCNTFARNNVTLTNCYYLNALGSVPSGATQKSVLQFTYGEAAYALNGSVDNGVWKQTIGTDKYPNFNGKALYKTTSCTCCTNNANEKETVENGVCKNCGKIFKVTPAVWNASKQVYEIGNASQFFWFAALVNGTLSDVEQNQKANAVLKADIDIGNNSDFVPIGSTTGLYYTAEGDDKGYQGTFDGNGFVIKNLMVKGSDSSELTYGVFGTLTGTVKNLGVENFTFTLGGKDCRVGGIAGQIITGGTVSNCYVKDSVITATGKVAGGIAGCNYAGTVYNCHTYNVTVTASRSGGIVGDNRGDGGETDRKGTISNCYTDASAIENSQRTGNVENSAVKTAEQFASGEVAYLLQSANGDTLVWGQTSSTDGATPVLTSNEDYRVIPVKSGDATVNYSVLKKGETNNDGVVDVYDYQNAVNIALSDNNDKTISDKYDINSDGAVDVMDCITAQQNGMSDSDYNKLLEKVEEFEGVCYMRTADFDGDGVVDILDIALFEKLMSGHRVEVKG